MRRYGLYDTSRGLTVALAAGVAGLLLWCSTLVGQHSAVRFWEAMGIVAAAGLVLGLANAGGWTRGHRLRLSPGTFLLGVLPVMIVVGWILMATQPGHGWYEGTIVSWSHNLGLMDVIHDLALWHGVLAFSLGLVLGYSFDRVPALERDVVVDRQREVVAPAPTGRAAADRPMTDRPMTDRPMTDRPVADEPLTAERSAVGDRVVEDGSGEPVAVHEDRAPSRMD